MLGDRHVRKVAHQLCRSRGEQILHEKITVMTLQTERCYSQSASAASLLWGASVDVADVFQQEENTVLKTDGSSKLLILYTYLKLKDRRVHVASQCLNTQHLHVSFIPFQILPGIFTWIILVMSAVLVLGVAGGLLYYYCSKRFILYVSPYFELFTLSINLIRIF